MQPLGNFINLAPILEMKYLVLKHKNIINGNCKENVNLTRCTLRDLNI